MEEGIVVVVVTAAAAAASIVHFGLGNQRVHFLLLRILPSYTNFPQRMLDERQILRCGDTLYWPEK
jgi:hypothetical protein